MESVWDVTIINGVWVFQVLSILVVRIWPPPKTKKTPLFQLPWTLSRRCDRLRDMAQPRPAKTYPLKAEQFAPEKLPKPNSEVYASNHGLFRGELLNFGSVFVFFWWTSVGLIFSQPISWSSLVQFSSFWWLEIVWVGLDGSWILPDTLGHRQLLFFVFDFFGPEKNWSRTRVAWQWEWCLKVSLQSCTNEKIKEMLFNNRIEGKMDRSWMDRSWMRYMRVEQKVHERGFLCVSLWVCN